MPHLLLALDQGTTSSRAILFDENARQLAAAQRELTQIYPKPGWVEHNPVEIWETQLATAHEVLELALLISVRRRFCGIAPRGSRCTMRSSGRIAGQRTFAAASVAMATPR
jgi:glycerol kinase